jgi:hypothetical protein
MSANRLGILTLAFAAGCIWQGTPVPVTGDTRWLEGSWDGTYWGGERGRSGTITFRLKAGTDSAWGDVVMLPPQNEFTRPPGAPEGMRTMREPAHLLRISFVRCEDGEVTGRLDPYQDPDTGERVHTTFEGRLEGKVFKGTFVSYYPGTGTRVNGKWEVKKQ